MSDKFRRQLYQEAEQWRAEDLITDQQYEQLSQRYQFQTLETASRNRFIMILIGLGSILLGLGVITFVAANWQAWPRGLKVTLLLSLFVGVNAAGFYLWRQPGSQLHSPQWRQRLGQGLLLLGALVLGANMALMSQMFHTSGPSYALFLVWGIGVLAMGYSLKLVSLGVLAFLLIGWGYWQSLWDVFSPGSMSWLRLIVLHMPLLSGMMFGSLAYWCRSRTLFTLAAIAVISSWVVNIWNIPWISVGGVAALSIALPSALLWGYDDGLWFWRQDQPSASTDIKPFAPVARSLALIFLATLFYSLSFHWLWDTDPTLSERSAWLLNWTTLLDVVILGGLTIWAWWRLIFAGRDRRRVDLTTAVIAGFIGISALVPLWHLEIAAIPTLAVVVFNILLFLLATGFIREGLSQGERRTFWFGLVLLTLQILSRLLEYETELLFKSFVFLLCGVGVIVVGLWFERYVRTLRPTPTPVISERNSP